MLAVFAFHKPWWPYYYIHTAIPLCWCAGVGLSKAGRALRCAPTQYDRHATPRYSWKHGLLLSYAVVALAWIGARIYLEVTVIRHSPQLYYAVVLNEIERVKGDTQFMYGDHTIYSFHTGIPMPPQLAVLPLKRFWAGEMTNDRVTSELAVSKPGVILLANDGREVPFQTLLQRDYRLVYIDQENRLYRRTVDRGQ